MTLLVQVHNDFIVHSSVETFSIKLDAQPWIAGNLSCPRIPPRVSFAYINGLEPCASV